jgi:hypothetical protein
LKTENDSMTEHLSDSQKKEIMRATINTANDLKKMAYEMVDKEVSMLSLPEVDEVIEAVARVIPAGNVPGLIASGLARIQGNAPSGKEVKRDMGMLFRGVNQMFDQAVLGAVFMGPAAVIWGYQNLLKLAGKDPEAAFPEGTWQFYVDYALREDSARHANETSGFDDALKEHEINLGELDRITAWLMTAIYTLHNYPRLLENEWRERVYIRELLHITDDPKHKSKYGKLYNKWLSVLPYRRMADARGDEDYPNYRRRKFDEWLFEHIANLHRDLKRDWLARVQEAKQVELAAYINQLSIQGYLSPDQYAESRITSNLRDLHIALVYGGHYYLIPACQPDEDPDAPPVPADVMVVRGQVAAIMSHPSQENPAELAPLAEVQRSQWPNLTKKLPKGLLEELGMLRLCPIILNIDPRNRKDVLSQIRRAERGVGDHALTVFDTRESFVFDQSHIYFDGAWGAALAEIMTNEALAWAAYLQHQNEVEIGNRPYSPQFQIAQSVREYLRKLPQITPEVSAETDLVRFEFVVGLRRLFKQRSDLLDMTVNDLLLLYRAIHAVSYEAENGIVFQLEELRQDKFSREAAVTALKALQPDDTVPAILIPVDASRNSPRDRIYPMSFEVPLGELNLLALHEQVMAALVAYEKGGKGDSFDNLQRQYLASLAGFGQVMAKAKEIANAGESSSVASIKLMAHMPSALQRLIDQVPDKFDTLNDIIKGREVFSNTGRVVKDSTLRRFITAKDDNEKKALAWGILTDDEGVMTISLRDFRPHVKMLIGIGQQQLAQRITQDYLDSYANGFNRWVADVQRITLKSRETKFLK